MAVALLITSNRNLIDTNKNISETFSTAQYFVFLNMFSVLSLKKKTEQNNNIDKSNDRSKKYRF